MMQYNKIPAKTLDEATENYNNSVSPSLDFNKIRKEAYIDPKDPINPPESVIVQDINGKELLLGTLGNISTIIGKAKSRKSFLMTVLTSCFLSSGVVFNFKNTLPVNKKHILYFDTEQSKYYVQLLLHRICVLSKIKYPHNLEVYGLRKYTPNERLEIIENIIYETKNLGVVVIDGIKDLITSINDEQQASMITSKLLKWSEELNIHVFTVLHQNKSDTNARGHIGTELMNKSEVFLTVTRSEGDKNISVVDSSDSRSKDIEPFAFEVLDNLPVLAENYEVRKQKKTSQIMPRDLEDAKLYSMLNSIYTNADSFAYSELTIQVKIIFNEVFGKSIGDNKAKELITYCKNKDWLIQEGNKRPYTLGIFKNVSV